MPIVNLSWYDVSLQRGACGWCVFASKDENFRGDQVATAPLGNRFAQFNLPKGRWIVRALMKLSGCGIESWPEVAYAELNVTGRRVKPATPSNAAVGQATPKSHIALLADPPSVDDEPHVLQVIEHPAGTSTSSTGSW